MFDENGQFRLRLGTSKNIFTTNILQERNRAVFLTKDPFNNKEPLLDHFTALAFLSTLSDKFFHFTQTKVSGITITGQRFTHYIEISYNHTIVFIFRFQVSGNYFVIQIRNTCGLKFNKENVKLNINSRNVYIYANQILTDLNAKSSLNFLRNSGISEISDFYNNSSVDRTKQNPLTPTLFYAVAPFNPKTIARTKNKIINPDNTINGIIQTFGGQFFRFHNNEDISLDDYPFQIFSWFSPYLDFIINSDQFDLITTVELDATFEALDPYVICVPHLIYRNTGIPIGILVSLSESASLYSIFFESLKKLDEQKPNESFSYLQIFFKKKYLTDEHASFEKLKKTYPIDLYHCFVHLIRTIGANSLLGFFLSDLLYTYSEDEWKNNYERMCYLFENLYKERNTSSDTTRFDKVSQVLGKDVEGNKVQINESYSPIYKRIDNRIPTTTNNIESFHMHLNQLTKGSKGLTLRLAITCKYILDRTCNVNKSVIENIKNYLNRIRAKAQNSVSINNDIDKYSVKKCNCCKKYFYTMMFGIDVPCIHEILNPEFDETILLETVGINCINFPELDLNSIPIEEYDIDTKLLFKKQNNDNGNSGDTGSLSSQSLPDYNIEENPIDYIITHTQYQLNDVIKKDQINLTIAGVKLIDEMMNNQKLAKIHEQNSPLFWALFQIRLWKKILNGKKHFHV
ncbi:hypothetical protein M9Y10_002086 [Tritrichomonas musculus]|uniref:MULE transposase domain-containing protein n=2 Tax=Tritrichomonas musculus TaxID=1915356 RepID=A0ABR2JTP6_9EUKA